MRLKVLGSSSRGNAYLLENDSEALLIECGVSVKEIKQAVDFNIRKIAACLISHEHGDHSKYAKEVLAAGIPVFATKGTGEACKISDHHGFNPLTYEWTSGAGGFRFIAYRTNHDVSEPCCFLIQHKECGNVLFLTDTYYTEYTFRNLNQVIIEANYCERIIDEKVAAGSVHHFLRDRILKSHMSIETCKQALLANDLSAVRNIVLIHLSDSNSDEARFKAEVIAATGKPVHIAQRGLVLEEFNKKPF